MAIKTYYDCIGVIQKAGGETITKAQAEELLDQIDALAQSKKKNGVLASLETLMMDELDNATNAIKESALIEKRNALINLKIQKNILTFTKGFKNPGEALQALMTGVHKPIGGALNSIDYQGKALMNGYLGKIINQLDQKGLLYYLTGGDYDREIAKELWELPGGKSGISGDKGARQVAEIINSVQNDLVFRQNRAGAYIKLLPGYIVKQSHDMWKIRKVTKEQWINSTLPRLDAEKTFGAMDPRTFLSEAYDGFVTGMHYKARGETQADSVTYFLGFKGPSNLAKKLSEQRLLHFKDADSWYEYNTEFGSGSFRESLISGIEHGSRNLALMEGLGTNPLATLDKVIKILRTTHKNDLAKFDSLSDYRLHASYMQLDGTSRLPVNAMIAKVGLGTRIVQTLSKLGGVTLSAITDIPFQVAALRNSGVPLADAYLNAFQSVLRGRGNAEQKEIARLIGVGFHSLIGDIHARFSSDDSLPGALSSLQQKFFKLNGLQWWTDTHKTGAALILSNHLAENRAKGFQKLSKELQRSLNQYNISATDWNLIREVAYKGDTGDWHVTPDRIQELSDSRIKEVYRLTGDLDSPELSRESRKVKDALELRLRTYYLDQIEKAVPEAGAGERALTLGQTQPGTVLGEALRFVMQFKTFPIAVARKALAPLIYKHGADSITEALFKGKADYLGLIHVIASTTVFGYFAMLAKDTFQGKSPKDPRNWKTWTQAMMQGGGLGIYGDFIFGEFDRFGRSALATLSGPTVGQIEDVLKIWSRIRQGESVTGQGLRLAMNNTPFINLFYTRMALDYIFLYQLQEMASPGFLSRLEGRIMKDYGQEFYMPPSGQIPYGGGDQFFEGVRR